MPRLDGRAVPGLPRDQDSQIILHVRMLDIENALQQEALGIVGVNLLYGAFFLNHDPDKLMESLLDNLTTRRIEIDMIEFTGIAFREVDNRVMSLRLVQLGLSDAAMFSATGEVLQPSEVLHKRPILVERGSFRPVTHVNVDMLRAAQEKFCREPDVAGRARRDLDGTHHAQPAGRRRAGQRRDRPPRLSRPGRRAGRLRHDRADFQLLRVLPAGRLPGQLHEEEDRHHDGRGQPDANSSTRSTTRDLEGGILESFGRLFKNDLKLYVYPLLDRKTGEVTTVQNLPVAPGLRKLYEYLVERAVSSSWTITTRPTCRFSPAT